MNLKKVQLTRSQQEVHDKIVDIADMFFSNKKELPFKINGFLIYGEPQTGKTETVKQICITLGQKFTNLSCCFVDASQIANPMFGYSEKVIDAIFNGKGIDAQKRVIFIDDIDCLFFGREHNATQTWHISMSSVMFHKLDNLRAKDVLFMSTSNKKELLDFAMQSRLMQIEMKLPSKEELSDRVDKMLAAVDKINENQKKKISDKIKGEIVENKTGFRDIQFRAVQYISEATKDVL